MLAAVGLIVLQVVVAHARGISGVDDRKEPYQVADPRMSEAARSVAAMIPLDRIKINGENARVDTRPFTDKKFDTIDSEDPNRGEIFPLDPETRFYGQPKAAQCAATLIAPDVLMTAGHCLLQDEGNVCSKVAFVFGFGYAEQSSDPTTISAKDVYHCDQVLDASYWGKTIHRGKEKEIADYLLDYAYIKLDRRVDGRTPRALASSAPRDGSHVYTIGYPDGLPQKITDNGLAFSASDENTFFRTTLDVFHGNSGGPVIDVETGQIVGVISLGLSMDYILNKENCSFELMTVSEEDKALNCSIRASRIVEEFHERLKLEAVDFDSTAQPLK